MLYQLNNIHFDYGANNCLKQINIEIEDNSISAFVGPNGAGKSTLLNLFAFLEFPASGDLYYKSTKLTRVNFESLRKKTAYVQQNPYLLRGSVFNNVELGLKLQHMDKVQRAQRVNEVMHLLNIASLNERRVDTLSGGEAQKVAIARALALEPEVLILDEPFTFLDKSSIEDLEQLIFKLKSDLKKTVIFTTHNQIQAQTLADNIYSIVNGRCHAAELVNLLNGKLLDDLSVFDTGQLKISLAKKPDKEIKQIAIDPNQIVLSKEKLTSSMQNNYSGVVKAMSEENGLVTVTINVGEQFKVLISQNALQEMDLSIGKEVWLSFKSAAILLC